MDVESKSDNPMQTFVFSATMSKDLQRNLKRWKQMKNKDGDNTIGKFDMIGMLSANVCRCLDEQA